VLRPGEKPEPAVPRFALGGCEWILLNPLDRGAERLDLVAGEVLPGVVAP
jgi:hypothetical protein